MFLENVWNIGGNEENCLATAGCNKIEKYSSVHLVIANYLDAIKEVMRPAELMNVW